MAGLAQVARRVRWRGASGGEAGDVVLDAAEPQDTALIAYTSGTTGAPKGAVLTHANLLANSESIAVTWRWGAEDRLVHALPIFHGHGLCVALYTSLLTGASVVLLPRFEVERRARRLRRARGHDVLRRPHHVPPAGGVRAGWGSWRGCAWPSRAQPP